MKTLGAKNDIWSDLDLRSFFLSGDLDLIFFQVLDDDLDLIFYHFLNDISNVCLWPSISYIKGDTAAICISGVEKCIDWAEVRAKETMKCHHRQLMSADAPAPAVGPIGLINGMSSFGDLGRFFETTMYVKQCDCLKHYLCMARWPGHSWLTVWTNW
jgi:hypothetical protein